MLIDYDYNEEEEERAAYNEDKVVYHSELEEGYEDGMSDDDESAEYRDYYEETDEEDEEDEIGTSPLYGGRYGEYNYKYEYGYVDVDDDDDDDDSDDGGVN